MRSYIAPILFLCCLLTGSWVANQAMGGKVYVYLGEGRSPAAVRSIVDYSAMDRKALYRSAPSQLMTNAKVINDYGGLGVQLGHPLLSRVGGGKELGCGAHNLSGAFDRIEIVFVGTGVSHEGSLSRMTVDANCASSRDLNRLDVVWIPMPQIYATKAMDQELQLYGKNPMSVKLQNIPDHWPERWVLWSIRLYRNDNPNVALLVDTPALRRVRPALLSLEWKNKESAVK